MVEKNNPFSRSVASKQAAEPEPATPVSAAGSVQTSIKDVGLQQPVTESDNGHAGDTPNSFNDNDNAGTESFGLPGEVGIGRKGDGIDTPDDGANAGVDPPPGGKGERFGIDVIGAASQAGGGGGGSAVAETSGGSGDSGTAEISGGGGSAAAQTSAGAGFGSNGELGGGDIKGDLAAASGDHGPAIDLSTTDPLTAVRGVQSGGESLTDLQVGLANAAIAGASATAGGPSVADGSSDGGALAEAIAAADKEAPKSAPAQPDLSKFQKIGGGMTAEEAAEAEEPGVVDKILDWLDGDFKMDSSSGALPSRDFTGIDGFTPVGTTTQAEGGKAAGVSNLETSLSTSLGSKGGGVKDPGPDSDQAPPPTPEEFALRQAINAELGNVRIPGDVDPADGDGTNTGTASEANLNPADQILNSGATGLLGNPGTPGGTPAPSGGGGTPPAGPDGREILLEDGRNVDDVRTEDLPDFSVGSDPLVGFPTEDEAEEEQQETSSPVLSFDLQDSKDADDD